MLARFSATLVVAVLLIGRLAQAQWQVGDHAIPVGNGAGVTGFSSVGPCPQGGLILSPGTSSDPICSTTANSGAHQNGIMAIGRYAPVPQVGIFLTPTLTGAADSAGIQLSPTFSSPGGTIGPLYGIASAPAITAGSSTVTNFINIRAETISQLGRGGNTLQNVYGLWADEQTAGTIKNRSIFVLGGYSEFGGPILLNNNNKALMQSAISNITIAGNQYTVIADPIGNEGIQIGGISSPATFHQNTTHYFRSRDSTKNYVDIGSGIFKLHGTTSGSVNVKTAATVGGNFTITLPKGTTNFSATGGTGQVVKQLAVGGAFSVAQVGVSELSGLGTGVGTFLATASSANLAAAVTDETGTGPLVFANNPQLGANIGIGAAAQNNFGVNYQGSVTGGSSSTGLWLMPRFTAVASSFNYGAFILPTVAAGSATINNLVNLRLAASSKGAANTVNQAVGLWLDTQTAGATINRSIYVNGIVELNGQAGSFLAPGGAADTTPIIVASADGKSTFIQIDAYGAGFPGLFMRKARSTQAGPTAVAAGDYLFMFGAEGRDNSGSWIGAFNGGYVLVADDDFTTTTKGTINCMMAVKKGTTGNQLVWCVNGAGHIGHNVTTSTPTSASACGTTPGTPTGSDTAGQVVTGSGTVNGCTINFGTARAAAPRCVANLSSGKGVGQSAATTTSVTFTIPTSAPSETLTWHCFGI